MPKTSLYPIEWAGEINSCKQILNQETLQVLKFDVGFTCMPFMETQLPPEGSRFAQ